MQWGVCEQMREYGGGSRGFYEFGVWDHYRAVCPIIVLCITVSDVVIDKEYNI